MKYFVGLIILFLIIIILLMHTTKSISKKEKGWKPKILNSDLFLPDYSYAGYQWGEKNIPRIKPVLNVENYGATPNDGKDDTLAIKKAFKTAQKIKGPIVVLFPKGRFILKQILYIERNNFVIRGMGSKKDGTILYVPRPIKDMDLPSYIKEIKEELIRDNKKEGDKPYSPFSWSGGVLWTRVSNWEKRIKLAKALSGKRGTFAIKVDASKNLKKGDVVNIKWFNRDGKKSSLLQHVFGATDLIFGKQVYGKPDKALVIQPATVMNINGNNIVIKEPLLHDIRPEWICVIESTNYIKEVGIEHLRIEFPKARYMGHHLEDGYNGIFITNTMHSWVLDVSVTNSDSAILASGMCKNITMDGVKVFGREGHYSINIGSNSYGVLVKNFQFLSSAIHNPSFNTKSKLNVFTNGQINEACFDQHRGINHQNLFDNIKSRI